MEKNSVFSRFIKWLGTTEMFARPSKQLPGKWQLFEYYFDSEKDLNHITEPQLKKLNESWEIEFKKEECYVQ